MGNSTSKEEDHRAVGSQARQDDAAAFMAEAGGLCSRLELMLSCKNLANMDRGGGNLSDPFVVVNMHNGTRWEEVGRTEIIANNLNPTFVRRIIVLYKFEEVQRIRFDVYDVDTEFKNDQPEKLDLSKQDYQGCMEATIAEIAGSAGRSLVKPLQKPQGGGRVQGTLTVSAEEQANQNSTLRLKLKGQAFPSGLKPFLKINRTQEMMGGALSKTIVFKTEVVTKYANKAPSWAVFEVNISTLCQGDFFRPIAVEVFDWKKNGKHKLLGEFKTSPDQLLRGGAGLSLDFGGGKFAVEEVALISRPSFLDYIKGGMEVSFLVAIDFTASNGHPADPQSLHYMDPIGRTLNQYAAAITYVGEVLQFYDSDQKYPVYGFGGQFQYGTQLLPVSHCFACNGDPSQPEVEGINGILQAYRDCLSSVRLSGPTVFSHCIAQANRVAQQYHGRTDEQKYFVLLLLTDGILNDMDATIGEIIKASNLPLSILIVGVGNADFGNMNTLDSDDVKLRDSSGATARRDIVQFVPLRDFISPQIGIDRMAFSRALLEELPGQITEYFAMNRIPPNPPGPPVHSNSLPMPPPTIR